MEDPLYLPSVHTASTDLNREDKADMMMVQIDFEKAMALLDYLLIC